MLVKEFLYVLSEEWNFLKMHGSEIRVKRIRVNQGLGELKKNYSIKKL